MAKRVRQVIADDLKGKELSVDAITTGFAFVPRKLLERAGLRRLSRIPEPTTTSPTTNGRWRSDDRFAMSTETEAMNFWAVGRLG